MTMKLPFFLLLRKERKQLMQSIGLKKPYKFILPVQSLLPQIMYVAAQQGKEH